MGEGLSEVVRGDADDGQAERLAAYKVPTHYEFRSELPKTTVGKILRRELRDARPAGVAKTA